ncbi:uncharacterized protein LOC143186617 [Calliopsis andreniformis]|uniref:uncharacterized protein LOC143186617 n=1 Tax=Calliopsis andreniformis TaxID=337506 RepID=UPI003FCD58E3
MLLLDVNEFTKLTTIFLIKLKYPNNKKHNTNNYSKNGVKNHSYHPNNNYNRSRNNDRKPNNNNDYRHNHNPRHNQDSRRNPNNSSKQKNPNHPGQGHNYCT